MDLEKNEYIAFRIKHVEGLEDLNLIFNEMKSISKYCIVSKEGENDGLHIHGIVMHSDKKLIRKSIKKIYPAAIGNKCLYVQKVNTIVQCCKYTLKDGDYIYYGFPDAFIKKMFKLSTPKLDVKKSIKSNEDNLILKLISPQEFAEQYIKLKVDADQGLYSSHIKAYLDKMYIKAGYMTANSYLVKFYDFHNFSPYPNEGVRT